jgi:hypothetical protein
MTIYVKTEAGQRAFKERSSAISTRQRAAFILIDGKKPMQKVIDATAGMGIGPADFEHLLTCGYVELVDAGAGEVLARSATTPGPVQSTAATQPTAPQAAAASALGIPSDPALLPDALYRRGYPIATQLVSSLGLRGVRLNLAVESARGYDDLLALVPRIREAVGPAKCAALEQALRP